MFTDEVEPHLSPFPEGPGPVCIFPGHVYISLTFIPNLLFCLACFLNWRRYVCIILLVVSCFVVWHLSILTDSVESRSRLWPGLALCLCLWWALWTLPPSAKAQLWFPCHLFLGPPWVPRAASPTLAGSWDLPGVFKKIDSRLCPKHIESESHGKSPESILIQCCNDFYMGHLGNTPQILSIYPPP